MKPMFLPYQPTAWETSDSTVDSVKFGPLPEPVSP
jgi:hypothetical protein